MVFSKFPCNIEYRTTQSAQQRQLGPSNVVNHRRHRWSGGHPRASISACSWRKSSSNHCRLGGCGIMHAVSIFCMYAMNTSRYSLRRWTRSGRTTLAGLTVDPLPLFVGCSASLSSSSSLSISATILNNQFVIRRCSEARLLDRPTSTRRERRRNIFLIM